MADSLFSYSRPGFALEVFATRIEVSEGMVIKKRYSIPVKTITDVGSGGVMRKLTITTNDGKSRDYNVGGQAEKARSAILDAIAVA